MNIHNGFTQRRTQYQNYCFDATLRGPCNYGFYEGEMFCGFMSLLTFGDISHIIYFAMNQSLRNRGFGSKALQLLRQMKPTKYWSAAEICSNKNFAIFGN